MLDRIAVKPEYGIARILESTEIQKMGAFPDAAYFVELKPGYSLGTALSGPVVSPAPGTGAHGYLPDRPEIVGISPASGSSSVHVGSMFKIDDLSFSGATGVVAAVNQTPGSYALHQNFPNPFNPSTTIRYTVAGVRGQGLGTSEVRIVIYDVLGREVATLVNIRQLPGTYAVLWNAQGTASGVYFYRLTVGSFSAIRKLVLVR